MKKMMTCLINMKVTMITKLISYSKDEHPFSRLSHALGEERLIEGTKLIEFKEGIMFKNFREFA